jgi:AcrR family transcriptional regulator
MEAVATRARVGKPTIYRHWPNATALAMAALIAAPAPDTSVDATASPLADLRRQLARVASAFATPRGRQIGQMLAAAQADSEIAKTFRNSVILHSRRDGRALLERAIAAGEVAPQADIEVVLDLIYGPLFYRLLIGHAPLDATFSDGLLLALLRGLAPARVAR